MQNIGRRLDMSSNRRIFRARLGVVGMVALVAANGAAAQTYDTLIRGGTILDGSGLPPYVGDVAINGEHIVAVGKLDRATANTIVEARGMMVAPGFINIHSHARPDAVATAVNMLTQGVTTEITNADGHGTTNITTQLAGFSAGGLAENVGLYIGFNATWAEIVGEDDRRATPAEITTMRGIIDSNLAQGAWGVASGLDYKPGYYADVDEVVGVVSVARKWRTNFPNHDRIRPEENYSSFKGMAETIVIGEQAGLTPVITHIKTQGAEQGNAPAVIAMMDKATARGTYTAADVYPYLAGLSGLSLNIPGWAIAGGREAMLKRFADPIARAKIVEEAERAMKQRWGGPDGVYLFNMGRELSDIVREMNVRPGEAVVRLLEKQEHSAILRFGKESDVRAFLRYPASSMACDCGASLGDKGHPRSWGSFPRVLGDYVRKYRVLTWPDAIRKMTALPAATIGMSDRGYLAPGMSADVTIFDPRTVQDHATYEQPTKPSDGIRDVFVNGRAALRDGKATGAQGGEVVLRSRYMPTRPMTPTTARRRMDASGTVVKGLVGYDVRVAVLQEPRKRYATGNIRLTDRTSGVVWTGDRLGTLQTAPGWVSLTAVLRNESGTLRAATITIDRSDATATPIVPTLIVKLDDVELTGSLPETLD
jgi:N-acyl-D-aspartate/D-glutamate deacylase